VGEITAESSESPDDRERVHLQGPRAGSFTFRVLPWSTAPAECTLTVHAELTERTRSNASAPEPTVIAIVDSGINPYHVEFQGAEVNTSQHPSTHVTGYPDAADPLNLTLNRSVPYDVAVRQDSWDEVRGDHLYWIPGTKVVGAYHAGGSLAGGTPILDDDGHGTASAAVAAGDRLGTCEDGLIVAVEGTEGLSWALSQRWIDVVTNS